MGELSSQSSNSSEVSLPTPPDGQWGWVVVAASFMIHLIADGCAFSFGVLYVELLDYFGQGKGKTAWVGSLFVSVPLITGPIASALTNRYGCRKTTMAGGLIAAIGFVLSSFANSIEVLCLTFGLIAGFGLSMVYVPAVVIVAYYFEKKRAFATGIAVAGSGIGTFVFAPLSEHLITEYSWKGAVLIIGAIMLNISVCGAIFRPLVEVKGSLDKGSEQVKVDHLSKQDVYAGLEQMNGQVARRGVTCDLPSNAKLVIDDEPITHSLVQFPTYLANEMKALPPCILQEIITGNKTHNEASSDINIPDQCQASQSLADVTNSAEIAIQSQNMKTQTGKPGESQTRKLINEQAQPSREHVWHKHGSGPNNHSRSHIGSENFRPLYRKDIFYRGSLFRNKWNFPSGRAASCPNIAMNAHQAGSQELINHAFPVSCIQFSKEVKHITKQMLDTSILHSSVFVYFSLSCMLLYMWYDVPYVYTPDKAVGMGIAEDKASYLVSILGIVSTVGQIVIGYLGDRPKVNTLHLYNVLTSIAGIATILLPLIPSYFGLCFYSAVFGFFISGNYALTTIILVDLLGMEKLTNAYGVIMLAEGISNLVGPPVAGKYIAVLQWQSRGGSWGAKGATPSPPPFSH